MKLRYILAALLYISSVEFSTAQCWTKVSSSSTHSLAIQNDGSLWAWGSSSDLGIGIPALSYYSSPIQVGTETDWAEISAGANFSLAFKNDGSLWTWGSSANPVLGGNNSTNLSAYTPVRVGNDNDWIQISAGGQHALALKSDKSLWAWGMSNMGQVGNGLSSCTFCTPVYQTIPVQIGTDKDWKQISACQDFSLALKLNGSLWAWGGNWPTLVNNSLALNNIPTQVGTDTSWIAVDGGEYSHVLALKNNGTIWSWGYDIRTDTPFVVIPAPVQIGNDRDWAKISAGTDHDMAVKDDGTLWSWGRNAVGQIGNGTVSPPQRLPQMLSPSINNNFTFISAGGEFSLGIKSDASLWGWGNNGFGMLGVGNNQNQTQPAQVSCNGPSNTERQHPDECVIAPNPTSGSLAIKVGESLINTYFQVYNTTGKIVLSGKLNAEITTIETSELANGIYLLYLEANPAKAIRFVKI